MNRFAGAAAIDDDKAAALARIALGHVTREYPNKLDHVLHGPGDAMSPAALHPLFHGSFDWHSCVHGYWMLARLLRLRPGMAAAAEVVALFDANLVATAVAGECAYVARPGSGTFERPYGWAWLLKLAEELAFHRERPWSAILRPLAAAFAGRFLDYLPKATYPVRTGTHANSAFALGLAIDYARSAGDAALASLVTQTALHWFAADEACPAWGEPGGEDFLSPTLMEAACMARVLPSSAFVPWLDRFLPEIAHGHPEHLFIPATVSDRSDGRIAHLDGLNLSRAWCWSRLAGALAATDARCAPMRDAAQRHLAASLPHLAEDYMGEHWLATFAVLALTARSDPTS